MVNSNKVLVGNVLRDLGLTRSRFVRYVTQVGGVGIGAIYGYMWRHDRIDGKDTWAWCDGELSIELDGTPFHLAGDRARDIHTALSKAGLVTEYMRYIVTDTYINGYINRVK